MYKYLIFIFLFLGIASANAQTILYQENFDRESKDWPYFDSPDLTNKVENGVFKFTYKKAAVHAAKFVSTEPSKTINYSIETAVEHLKGVDNFGYGITFGAKDVNNLYFFGISANGSFTLYSFANAKYTNIINWTPSVFIYRTAGFKNKLKVEKRNNKIYLFINGQVVGNIDAPAFFGDKCGVMVQMNQTVAFDDFIIKSTNNTTPNEKLVTPVDDKTGTVAYVTTFDKDDNNDWVVPPKDSVRMVMENGFLKILSTGNLTSANTITVKANWVDMDRDFLLESETIFYNGKTNIGYGVTFGTDEKQSYHFYIEQDGYFCFSYLTNTGFRSLIPWTESLSIKRGLNAKNKLSIVRKKGKITFHINDTLVYTYADIGFIGHQFGVISTGAQNVGFDHLSFKYLDNKVSVNPDKEILKVDTQAPEINILSPEVTRGLKVVSANDGIKVTGIAKDDSRIATVTINGVAAILGTDGSFSADVPLKTGENTLTIVATDEFKNQGNRTFFVTRNLPQKAPEKEVANVLGKYYALIIGVQNYEDETITDLEHPIQDATNLMNTLKTTYTFDEQNINLLKNPTRLQILGALEDLITKVKPDDNVLVFYAGHGLWLDARQEGFWFPSDTKNNQRPTYVSNAEIKEYLSSIKSKHTLLITDACFAGSIFKTRSVLTDAPKAISILYDLPSRKAMTSGALKEVPDKSVFVEYLLKRLKDNKEKHMSTEDLFSKLKNAVMNNSTVDQTPMYGEIKSAGDEGGDFIFIKR